MPSIPKNLKLHIAKSGLTINEFCDLADVSKGTFFNILKNKKGRETSTYKIINAFNNHVKSQPKESSIELVDYLNSESSIIKNISVLEKCIGLLEAENARLKNKVKDLKNSLSIYADERKTVATFSLSSKIDVKSINEEQKKNHLEFYQKLIDGFADDGIRGDFSILGYTINEIKKFTINEWIAFYHPETLLDANKTLDAIINGSDDYRQTKGVRMLKAKDGTWKGFYATFHIHRINNETWYLDSYWEHMSGESK